MRKFALAGAGVSAVIAMAVIGAGPASADAPDVTGETYGKAVAILKNQGYKAVFGGSIGDGLSQPQCVVIDQQAASHGVQRLRLDCTVPEGQETPVAPNTHSLVPPGGSVPGVTEGNRPTPGAGTVTVTPVPVG